MRKTIFVILTFVTYLGYSQPNSVPIIYLDDDNNQISQLTYSSQLLKKIYKEQKVETDTLSIRKLIKLYEFDSLNSVELQQIRKIFQKFLNVSDFDKNIIIVYRDSLLGFNEFLSSANQRHTYDAMDVIPKKDYLKRRKVYDTNQKKCKKFLDKNNSMAIYGYSETENFEFKPKHYKNQKLPIVLKSVFFQNKNRGTLILKPDGKYFFYDYLTQKQLIRILNSDWEKYIADYKSVITNDDIYIMNFISEMYKERRSDDLKLAKAQRDLRDRKKKNSFYEGIARHNSIIQTPYNCFGYAAF